MNKPQFKCSWLEACHAVDYALNHFGNCRHDRGLWVWYCQRIGLNRFLDSVDAIVALKSLCDNNHRTRMFQKSLSEILPKGGAK